MQFDFSLPLLMEDDLSANEQHIRNHGDNLKNDLPLKFSTFGYDLSANDRQLAYLSSGWTEDWSERVRMPFRKMGFSSSHGRGFVDS